MAIALIAAPFVVLWVFDRVLGIEERDPEATAASGPPPHGQATEAKGGIHAA